MVVMVRQRCRRPGVVRGESSAWLASQEPPVGGTYSWCTRIPLWTHSADRHVLVPKCARAIPRPQSGKEARMIGAGPSHMPHIRLVQDNGLGWRDLLDLMKGRMGLP